MSGLRVVSLVPSATETLLAWEVRPVGVTRFCEQPGFATVGGTKDPHIGAIVALKPDLVVMCDQENRVEDAVMLAEAGIAVHAISITHVDHVRPQMAALATALGLENAPVCGLDPKPDPTPWATAWIPIWKRPWMTINGDTYGSTLLSRLGIRNITGTDPNRYPEMTLEDAVAAHPDVVLAPSEPYPFASRHVAQLSAVGPVVLIDGQDLFWWGARTSAAATRLAAALNTIDRPQKEL